MFIVIFLQLFHLIDAFGELSPIGHDAQMVENVYNSVLYPSPDAVVRLALEAGDYNIVDKTSYSPWLLMLHSYTIQRSIGG